MSVGFLMLRYLKVNGFAGLIGLAVWMIVDVIYVFVASGNQWFLDMSAPFILVVASIVFLRANWPLAAGGLMRRLATTILLALPSFLLWLLVGTLTLLWFHPFIGGSE